jgi:ketosteroid isomerase-like protein
MKPVDLVQQLVRAFGKAADVLDLLAPDAVWHLYIGHLPPGGTHAGRDAIAGLMNGVFGPIYVPDSVRVTVHDAFGTGDRAVVRFRLEARTAWGSDYSNEYSLMATTSDGRVTEVWEFLDGIAASEQLRAGAPGE